MLRTTHVLGHTYQPMTQQYNMQVCKQQLKVVVVRHPGALVGTDAMGSVITLNCLNYTQ